MTTTEEKQAKVLADWIDGDRTVLPEADVMVAVWAMRADLAPKPNVSIEDVLARVESGPMSDQEQVLDDNEDHDDFVSQLFSQIETPVTPRVSLEDVLARVESGPLAKSQKVPAVLSEPNTAMQSANNNRWWNAKWLAGGLAAALVLFTLLPSGFEAPVTEDSIFAPKYETEKALAAEEVENELPEAEPEQANRQQKMPASAKPTPAKRTAPEDQPTISQPSTSSPSGSGLVTPSTPVDSDKKDSTKGIQVAQDMATPVPETDLIKSERAEEKVENNATELFGVVGGESVTEGAIPSAPTAMAEQVLEEEVLSEPEEAELDDAVVVVDSVQSTVVETVAKESRSRPKRDWRKKSKSAAPSAEMSMEAEPAPQSRAASAEDADTDQSDESLPSLLTSTERQQMQSLSSAEEVQARCDTQEPTKSLERIWVTSLNKTPSDAITILLLSNQYNHGDPRYLKRNWLLLATQYRNAGQTDQALRYEQLAQGLP